MTTLTLQEAYEQRLFLYTDCELVFHLPIEGIWDHVIVNIREVEHEDHLVVHCGVCFREFKMDPQTHIERRELI